MEIRISTRTDGTECAQLAPMRDTRSPVRRMTLDARTSRGSDDQPNEARRALWGLQMPGGVSGANGLANACLMCVSKSPCRYRKCHHSACPRLTTETSQLPRASDDRNGDRAEEPTRWSSPVVSGRIRFLDDEPDTMHVKSAVRESRGTLR